MSSFNKVVGYESIKKELYQIIDMIKNKDVYEKLGAKMCKGALLYGVPGLGKTLMAKCFIEESGLETYTIRRNKGNDDFIGLITETFKTAAQNAPSIVFLDDMDKFANEDSDHTDTAEYVAVQSGIDEVKDYDVFVLATCNDIDKLPDSLIRAGRFDRRIEVKTPTEQDTIDIIKHYLSDKKVSKDINMEDLSKMISYSSCAELETILNEAAISAAYNRQDVVGMDDIISAVLRKQYNSPDDFEKVSEDSKKRTALHEAGHLVVSEILNDGSIGLVSIRSSGRDNTHGFTHRCKEDEKWYYNAMIGLAGKAAVEMFYQTEYADGCGSDLKKIYNTIRSNIAHNGSCGLSYVYNNSGWEYGEVAESIKNRNEMLIETEMEKYYLKAKEILTKNIEFLKAVTDMLVLKETLLYSDIKKIKESVKLVKVEA